MKRLRPFVTFNYDLRANLEKSLSRSQKAEITRYYNRLSAAITDKHIVYRPKTTTNRKKAAAFTGQKLPKLKAFALNSPTGAGTVKWRGGEAVISKEGGLVRTIYPNRRLLATNPRAYLTAILRDDRLYIVNSKYDWRGGGSKAAVINKIENAMLSPMQGGSGLAAEVEDGELAVTIIEVNLSNQNTFLEYYEARGKAQRDENETNRKARNRERSRKRRQRGRKRK